jgi:methionine synthase II (cobalamin-independent)
VTGPWPAPGATGVGSLPGDDPDEACRIVVGELGDPPGLPHLPELPDRGAGADLVGRTAALLEGLAVDLQPAGWRLVARPGLDQGRALALLGRDLDALELALLAYRGAVKVQLCGPWTLAAALDRGRGDRVLADHGARRDVAQSLAETVAGLRGELQRRVPGAAVVVQLDEPALPAVLAGAVPTASGFGRLRAVDEAEALGALQAVLSAAGPAPVVHCCGAPVPFPLLARAGAGAVSFDLVLLPDDALAAVGEAVDAGVDLWPGVVAAADPDGRAPTPEAVARRVTGVWSRVGFGPDVVAERTVLTPSCGLAGASPRWARTALDLVVRAARLLARG